MKYVYRSVQSVSETQLILKEYIVKNKCIAENNELNRNRRWGYRMNLFIFYLFNNILLI